MTSSLVPHLWEFDQTQQELFPVSPTKIVEMVLIGY